MKRGLLVALLSSTCLFATEAVPRDAVFPLEPVEMGPVLDSRDFPSVDLNSIPQRILQEGTRTVFERPNDPMFSAQWYYYNEGQEDDQGQAGISGADIKLFPALKVANPKKPVLMAIVDSGLDLNHEDVDPEVLWVNPGESGLDDNGEDKSSNGIDDDGNGYVDDVHGWNFVKDDNNVQDRHYHGTHVNGLLSAVANNGVGITGGFPELKVMIIKIFGLGATASRDKIALGIRYACDQGVKVLSNSWGSSYYNENIKSAIAYCQSKGALFVNAAGNRRNNMDVEPDYPSAYDLENQIIVGASDHLDLSADFSNYGSMIDIAAPGHRILSLLPKNKYRTFSGTSQACPMVAAAISLLWAQEPQLSWREVKERLIRTADKRLGLKRFVPTAARLNVYNLLLNKEGEELPQTPTEGWISKDIQVESKHPYEYNSDEKKVVHIENAQWIRLVFERLEMGNHSDSLSLLDSQGRIVERLNAEHKDLVSLPIQGDTVVLHLKSNHIVNHWGYKVSRVEYIPAQ